MLFSFIFSFKKMFSRKNIILWTLIIGNFVRQPTVPKLVSNGWIQGSISADGLMEEYLGIPYASITQRFQAPGPEPTWDGIFQATNDLIPCLQKYRPQEENSTYVFGQNDCLILNVFVPVTISNDNTPLPVMVFIHGGGFIMESSTPSIYGPQYLVPHGVVLVTINYRLHIEGFLCLGTKYAPGNAGLKDQVAALKWVKKNISKFGGDPDNVTLFGESAGAASVSFHVLSPLSKGLFHKAILQSGASIASWALQYEPIKFANVMAKALGHNTKNVTEMYELFVRTSEKELILTKIPRPRGESVLSILMFLTCVEKNIEDEPAFLTDTPRKIFESGQFNKVPMIIGSNGNEGIFFADMESDISKFEIANSLPKDLLLLSSERKEIANKVSEVYMDNKPISNKSIANISKFFGEPFINYPCQAETALIVNKSTYPVYNYLFNFDGYNNFVKIGLKKEFKEIDGPIHADELMYLFKPYSLPPLEYKMIKRMTTMWTNFAKYGDPTPEVTELLPKRWPPVNLSAPVQTFVIDREFSMAPLWFQERLKFWDTIYANYKIVEKYNFP